MSAINYNVSCVTMSSSLTEASERMRAAAHIANFRFSCHTDLFVKNASFLMHFYGHMDMQFEINWVIVKLFTHSSNSVVYISERILLACELIIMIQMTLCFKLCCVFNTKGDFGSKFIFVNCMKHATPKLRFRE